MNPATPTPLAIKNLDAETVEQAVHQLHGILPELAYCVRCRWVHEFSSRRLAKEMDGKYTDIWNLVCNAELTLQGML